VYADTPTATRFLDRPDDELIAWARGRAEVLFPELAGHFRFAEVTHWPFMGTSNRPGIYRLAAEALARLDLDSPVRPAGNRFTKSSQGAVVASGERAAADLLARFSTRVAHQNGVRDTAVTSAKSELVPPVGGCSADRTA
jgi:hypothetical protein